MQKASERLACSGVFILENIYAALPEGSFKCCAVNDPFVSIAIERNYN